MYINGNWVAPDENKSFVSTNPATGEPIDSIVNGSALDASKAIESAQNAFNSWSSTTPEYRATLLLKACDLVMERQSSIAQLLNQEQGKPLKAAMNEVAYAADFLRWYGEEAKRIFGTTLTSGRSDQRFITLKSPVGVVAAITPWNYPVSMITRKVAPALAAGCTIVLKPAEATPLCAMEMFRAMADAGIPAGVINLVTCEDPKPIGEIFLSDNRVKKLSFTGSTAVGRYLAGKSGHSLKRISLELGGHAPFIVYPDADPVHAAKGAALVKFLNTGQACISPNRFYVHESIADTFLETLTARVSKLQPGSGFGPLVNDEALNKIENHLEDAVQHGASIVTGGMRMTEDPYAKGHFFAPTILSGVTDNMKIYREETFGPVAPIITFSDTDDVLELANDTNYGLAAYVYTKSLPLAFQAMERLRFGIIGINDINPTSASIPFGGMNDSGIGREGGKEGLEEYMETKSVGLSI